MNILRWLRKRSRCDNEAAKFVDTLEIIHIRDGKIIAQGLAVPDLVTNAGKAAFAGLLNGVVGDVMKYVAIGTGTTAADATDTTLETEITTGGGARAEGTCSRVTTTVTNDTAQVEYTFTFTDSFAITECGLLNAASEGTLGCRQVFSPYNVVATDLMTFRWKVKAA